MDVPRSADPKPSWYGESVGHYEGGDTLVIDTIGLNNKTFLNNYRTPHTEKLHLIEKFTRTDYNTLRYDVTIDDPGAYSKQWTGGWNIPWSPNAEMYEYVCQDNNRDVRHMYGGER